MLSLFTKEPLSFPGRMLPLSWDLIQANLKARSDHIRHYYQHANTLCSATHPLVRLLESCGDDPDLMDKHASQLHMTTDTRSGIVRAQGSYISAGTSEAYYCYNHPFDEFGLAKNWKDATAVYPLYHESKSLDLPLLNGKSVPESGGLAVFAIHLGRLAVKYRNWKVYSDADPGLGTSTQSFVGRYVLSTMGRHYLELALFNRLCAICADQPVPEHNPDTHPFIITEIESRCDHVLHIIQRNIDKSVGGLHRVLQEIPGVWARDAQHALRIPQSYTGMQNAWMMFLSRIFYIEALCILDTNPIEGERRVLMQELSNYCAHNQVFHQLRICAPQALQDRVWMACAAVGLKVT